MADQPELNLTPGGRRPIPARITAALDACGLSGPEVDIACGGREPDVDLWEKGLRTPSVDQVRRLADLTGHPVEWFYRPVDDTERGPHRMFVCRRSARAHNRLTVVVIRIDENDVLHYEFE